MPQVCTVCKHPDRAKIDAEIVGGTGNLTIAKRYHLSKDAVRRHGEGHLPARLAMAAEAVEVASADALLGQLERLRGDAERIKRKAERGRDFKTALAGVRELTRLVELAARLAGELPTANVNLVLSPEWTMLRTRLLAALLPYPEARVAVSRALLEANVERTGA